MTTLNAYTMETWISAFRNQKNTVSTFAWKKLISDGTDVMLFSDETILSKYAAELEPFKVTKKLSATEQHYYKYNPRLFSYEIYGHAEFWYLVLYANEMHSAVQFDVPVVKFYDAGCMSILNGIRDLERERYNAMEHEITTAIVGKKAVNVSKPLRIIV